MKDKFNRNVEFSKNTKIVVAIIVFLIVAISFVCGFFINSLTLGSKKDSVNWAIGMIDKYGCYYDENSGTIKEYSANDYLQMITESLDAYSDYYTEEEYQLELQTSAGNLYGNGLYYTFFVQDEIFCVRKVIGNSPADNAGFKVGDIVLSVEKNGETIEFSQDYSPIEFVKDSIENVEYVYNVKRDDKELKISCKRGVYKSNFVKYYDSEKRLSFVSENNEPLQKSITDNGLSVLDNDTALIELQQFEGNAVEGIKTAMEYLKERGKTKLILDLRENVGGFAEDLKQIASYLVHKEGNKKPLIFVAKDKQNNKLNLYASGDNYNQDLTKIVVLANENTASASECLIGAMLYYGSITESELVIEKHVNEKKEIVATTYGKGIMQNTFPRNKTGEAIKLTTAVVYQPDGVTTIHKKGFIANSENSVEKGKAIERAIEILG